MAANIVKFNYQGEFMYRIESSLEKVGKITSAKYNLIVHFEGNDAYTNGKEIYIPYLENLTKENKILLNGYMDHEVAHCLFTDFSCLKDCLNEFHHKLLNMVEDVRIERLMIYKYPGCRYFIGKMNEILQDRTAKSWDKVPWPFQFIWNVGLYMQGIDYLDTTNCQEYLDLVQDELAMLNSATSTSELLQITKAMTDKILEDLPEENKLPHKPGKSEVAYNERMERESEGDKVENNSGQKGQKSSQNGKGQEEKEGYQLPSAHTLIKEAIEEEIERESTSNMNIVNDHSLKSRQRIIASTTRFDIETNYSNKGNSSQYSTFKSKVQPMISKIRRDFERVLKVKENSHWKIERERGVLNNRSLSRLITDGGYRTPFKQKFKNDTTNVAVQILIDQSGSMGGSRIETAKLCAVAMGEALNDLGISFEITGFSSQGCSKLISYTSQVKNNKRFSRTREALILDIFKDFQTSNLNGITRLSSKAMNPDGECVIWASKRLLKRKEKRKILFVLSDGQPATGENDSAVLCNDLKLALDVVKKEGIETIGLGIESDAVSKFYKDFIVINKLEELPRRALKKMTDILLREVA
jgi:cobalamin biosynthesis protein CobT